MGNMGENHVSTVQHEINQSELQCDILQKLKDKRLDLSHQPNIYLKCLYMQRHYDLLYAQEIVLSHNMISEQVMEVLSKINFHQSQVPLKLLDLSYNELTCQSLKWLKRAHLSRLFFLYLQHNHISTQGCLYIVKSSLDSLITLDLSANAITNDSCFYLAQAKWPNICTLLLNQNQFTEKGLIQLSAGEWPKLAFLQAKDGKFQASNALQEIKFKSKAKCFRIELR